MRPFGYSKVLPSERCTACVELLRQDRHPRQIRTRLPAFCRSHGHGLAQPKGVGRPYPSDLEVAIAYSCSRPPRLSPKEPFDPKDYGAEGRRDHLTSHLSCDRCRAVVGEFDILDPAFRPHLEACGRAIPKLQRSSTPSARKSRPPRRKPHGLCLALGAVGWIVNDRRKLVCPLLAHLTQLEAMVGKPQIFVRARRAGAIRPQWNGCRHPAVH